MLYFIPVRHLTSTVSLNQVNRGAVSSEMVSNPLEPLLMRK